MESQVDAADPRAHGGGGRWSWLLPAATFAAGCVLGGTLVGVGSAGPDDSDGPSPSAVATAEPDDGADEDAGDADAGLYVRVPDACVETAVDAATLVERVDRVVAAIADLQPEPLRRTVDEVQQIRDRVDAVAEQCRREAARRLQDTAGVVPTPAS
jgi:hypothetical protein